MTRLLLIALLAATPLAAAAAAPPPSLEARLQRVEDELAIQRALVDYAAFFDNRDYTSYVNLFTADGEWANTAGSNKGQAAIRAMLDRTLGPPPKSPNRANYHIVSNPQVTLDGDRATAISRYLFVMRGPDGRPVAMLAGIYRDDLVRTPAGWRIRRRVADDVMPTAEEWARIVAAQARPK